MASRTSKAIFQVATISVLVVYYLTFVSLGVSTAILDRSLRQDNCGKSTHVWKYAVLNTIFAAITLVTYVTFPGGGEGARARALMVSILHFGLGTWGFLLRTNLPDCVAVIHDHYYNIHFFFVVCLWHNLVFFVLYVSHELYLGEMFGGDLTLIPEVRKHDSVVDFSYQQPYRVDPVDKTPLYNSSNLPPSAHLAPSAAPVSDVPTLLKSSNGGGGGSGEISQEYAILQSQDLSPEKNVSSSDPRLPGTAPRGL